MTTTSESLTDLASSMALTALPYLSEKHLNALGIITILKHIRPEEQDIEGEPKEFPEFYSKWLQHRLSWIGDDFEITYIDYMHLVSTSCLDFSPLVQ